MRQKTLAKPVTISGKGVHSNANVTVELTPAPCDAGVVFVRTDLDGAPAIPVLAENIAADALTRQTTLALPGRPEVMVATVEHFLGAFCGLGIDNCHVAIDGPEVPFGDGSAKELTDALMAAGFEEQMGERNCRVITKPIAFCEGDVDIVALPNEQFRLTFFIDFPQRLIGRQAYSLVVTPESFCEEIAFARTFCMKQEVDYLRAKGLIKGGSLDVALVVDDDRLVNESTALRAPDEFVRHKILDLLGDLYVLGRPIQGHVIASRSGHASHAQFVARLREEATQSERLF